MNMIKYQHYKGGIYEFISYATHSETNEKLVMYRNSEGETFARPHEMFFEGVSVKGEVVPRFKEIKSVNQDAIERVENYIDNLMKNYGVQVLKSSQPPSKSKLGSKTTES